MATAAQMMNKTRKDRPKEDFIKQSSLYQEFLAEREEILKYKWLESEKVGYDIGFERALLDWIRKYRDNWRENRRAEARKKEEAPSRGEKRGRESSPERK